MSFLWFVLIWPAAAGGAVYYYTQSIPFGVGVAVAGYLFHILFAIYRYYEPPPVNFVFAGVELEHKAAAEIGFLVKFSRCDVIVHEKESDFILKYIEENYSDVSPDVIHTAYTEACSNDEIPIDDYIKKLHIFFGGHRPDRLHFLQVACDLAVCDNELNKEEYGVLLDLEHAFNLQGETDHYFKRNYGDEMKWKRYILTGISQEELDRSYALFECGNKIPLRTLKAIYRRKCFEYHPDRLKQSNSDITPEEAEKAIRDLNEAYRIIMLGTGNKERVS